MTNARLKWRLGSSSLRLLLKLNDPSINNVEQFQKIKWRNTIFIYNSKTSNIIATIAKRGNTIFIRYRQSSHYAHVFMNLANCYKDKYEKVIILASHNVGRWQRRIEREVSNSFFSYKSREEILVDIIKRLNLKRPLADRLTSKAIYGPPEEPKEPEEIPIIPNGIISVGHDNQLRWERYSPVRMP